MRILGIDHGTLSGWAIVDDGKFTDCGSFFISTNSKVKHNDSYPERFIRFEKHVNELLDKYKPDIVALEYPADMTGAETARYLIGLFTIAKLCIAKQKLQIDECYPTSVKKHFTGDGRAEKYEVACALSNKYDIPIEKLAKPIYYKKKPGIKTHQCDSSDATALAFYSYYINK